MIKTAKEILLEKGIDIDKIRREKKATQQKNAVALVQAATEWLERQPVGAELLLRWNEGIKTKQGFRFYKKAVRDDDGTVTVEYHIDYDIDKCGIPDDMLRALGFSTFRPIDDKDFAKYAGFDPYTYVSLPTE